MTLIDLDVNHLVPGNPVEVRNRFDGSWSDGFEIAEVLGSPRQSSYRIRRLSDGDVLPLLFDEEAVAEVRPSWSDRRPVRSVAPPPRPTQTPLTGRLAA